MTDRIKIYIDTPFFTIGGVESFSINLAMSLVEDKNYDVCLIESVSNKHIPHKLPVEHINKIKSKVRIISSETYFSEILAGNINRSVTITSWNRNFIEKLSEVYAAGTISKEGNKIIGYVHNESSQYFDIVLLYERLFDSVVCVSEGARDFLQKSIPSLTDKLIYKPCPTSINIDSIQDKQYSLPESKMILSFVGRLDNAHKGIFRIPEILKELRKNNINFFIKIIGGGPDKDALTKLLKEYKNDFEIYFANDQNEVKKLLEDVDVIILPSNFEGGPLVIYEAMACGVIPVVHSVGNMPKLIKHEHNGYIFSVGHIQGFVETIIKLYNNRYLLTEIGLNAYDTVKTLGYFQAKYTSFLTDYIENLMTQDSYSAEEITEDVLKKLHWKNNDLLKWLEHTIPGEVIRKYGIKEYLNYSQNKTAHNIALLNKQSDQKKIEVSPDNLPLIGIVVPVYKCEEYIEQCLDSIIAQSIGFDKLEVILVDDCSPCNASKIIEKKYVKLFPNIKLIKNKKNLGPGGARNVAIKECRAKLVAFVDGDDWLHPQFCEKVLADYNINHADITVVGMMNTTDGKVARWKSIPPKGIFTDEKKLDLLFTVKIECHTIFRLYNINLFKAKNIWFKENVYYEDTALTPQLFYHANKISCIEDVLYNYRFNPESIVNTSSSKHIEDINFAWQDLLQSVPFNALAIKFFWWLYAHNIFRKRYHYLEKEKSENLAKFFRDFFSILKRYPILLENMENNADFKEIKEKIYVLDEIHGHAISKIENFPSFKEYAFADPNLVSVIMPVYNTVSYISEAVNSILTQTYKNIELIIVNDCSDDGTTEVIEQITDSRVKVVNLPVNSGAYFSRNLGMFISKGAIITTVDSDDIISPERIEKFVKIFSENKDVKLAEDRFIRFHDSYKLEYRLFTQGVGYGFLRRSVLDDIGYFMPIKGGGDSELSFRIRAFYGEKSAILSNEFTYWARQRIGSLTNINPQGSPSREEFIAYFKSEQAKGKIFIEFPWRQDNQYVKKVLSLKDGQKRYLDKIQNVSIKRMKSGSVSPSINTNKGKEVYYNFVVNALGHYYNEFEMGKERIVKLNNRINQLEKEKEEVNRLNAESKGAIEAYQDQIAGEQSLFTEKNIEGAVTHEKLKQNIIGLQNEKAWYARTYDHLPKWYLKIGGIFRRIRF